MADKYQYIRLPDGSYGKFSADATDQQIQAVIARDFPQARGIGVPAQKPVLAPYVASSPLERLKAAAQNAKAHAKNLVTGPYHAFMDAPRTPEEQRMVDEHGGTGGTFVGPLNHAALGFTRMLVEPSMEAWKRAYSLRNGGGPAASLDPRAHYDDKGNYQPTAGSSIIDGIPIVGPMVENFGNEAHTKGNAAALAGLATDVVGAKAIEHVAPRVTQKFKDIVDIPRRAKSIVATEKAMSRPVKEDPLVTYKERYQKAKKMGVNYDLAQASGTALPKATKAVTEHSIIGRFPFEKNNEANVMALHAEAERMLDRIAPQKMSREEFGNYVKHRLLEHQQQMQATVNQMFADLSERLGNKRPSVSGIRSAAKEILKDNKSYYTKHPQLLKGGASQAWSILQNLAEGEKAPAPRVETSPLVDEHGQAITRTVEGKAPTKDTWSDLQNLRSDLMNLYRSPDIVGSRAEGWLKQMTGAVDQAMTNEPAGIPAEDVQKFRDANDLFSKMKGMYDNPTSPFYSIVRGDEGLTAADTISRLKPEAMRSLKSAAIDLEDEGLIKQAQRQRVERLLSPAGNEVSDMKGYPGRVSREAKEQLGGVLTPEQMQDIEDFAQVARPVYADVNPSGTGKLLQSVGEAGTVGYEAARGNFLPAAGVAAAGLAAKAVTSPAVVNAVMDRSPAAAVPASVAAPTADVPTNLIAVPFLASEQAGQDQHQPETAPLAPASLGGTTGTLPMSEKVVTPADPERGIRAVTLPTIDTPTDSAQPPVAVPTHPLGDVTGIDHDSGLPIVKRSTSPSPVAPKVDAAPMGTPQASVEDPHPNTHIFDLGAWAKANPEGDPEEARRAAVDAGYDLANA